MGRIVAIDYGTKRTGVAVSDQGKTFAFAYDTITTSEIYEFLKDYHAREVIELVVVGEPKNLKSEITHATKYVEQFVKKLAKELPGVPVERIDERFSSTMAKQSLIDSGVKKMDRRDKSLVDKVSAAILLQSWFEQQKIKLERK